jgi:predicted transcriptional regulator
MMPLMETIKISPDVVRIAVSRSGIAKVDIARRAGVHANSLSRIDDPGWSPTWGTLTKLCEAIAVIRAEREAV